MSERRVQIHTVHELPKTRRCELLEMARSSAYYRPEPISEEDLALMQLIEIIRIDRKYRDDAARKSLVSLFELLDGDHPLVSQYRPLMDAALH